jgi:hypothetical protein
MRAPAHRQPRLPGNAKDDPRDHNGDDGIGQGDAEGDQGGAQHHTEADEAIGAGVVAVCDQSGTVEAVTGAQADLRRDLVAEKADRARDAEREQVPGGIWADDLLDREDTRTQALTKIAKTTASPAQRSALTDRSRKAIPRGTAVSASPRLWIRSANRATLPATSVSTENVALPTQYLFGPIPVPVIAAGTGAD